MNREGKQALGWILGALLVLGLLALYLWMSSPEPDLLPSNYSVM